MNSTHFHTISVRSFGLIVALLAIGAIQTAAGAAERFTSQIDGDQQVPPVDTPATGTATLTLSDDESELAYLIELDGLDLDGAQTADGADDVTGLHIHIGPAGVGGGAIAFGIFNPGHDDDDLVIDARAGTLSGIWDATDPAFVLLADALDDLRSDGLYFNVHTVDFPGGGIRGQIEFQGDVHVVTAGASVFTPADITINPGDTVRWELLGGMHTVTEGTDGTVDGDEVFHSNLNAGIPVFEFTFLDMDDVALDYFCFIHFNNGMTGTITILPAPPAPCEGDANGDGTVDPLDSGFVLARFGCPVGAGDPSCDVADQNGDGQVDPLDSGFVLARFGVCP